MLDIQLLRGDTAAVAARLAQRGFAFDTARFETLENRRKDLQVKTEELQASRNSISKQIGALKGQGKHDEAQEAMNQVAQIKTDLEQAAADLDAVLEIAPYEPQFLSERGQVANGQKDFATSDRIFDRLTEAAKTLPDRAQSVFFQGVALRGQGYAAVERGQWQAAEQYYLQALRLNPNDQAAKNELDFVRRHRR